MSRELRKIEDEIQELRNMAQLQPETIEEIESSEEPSEEEENEE